MKKVHTTVHTVLLPWRSFGCKCILFKKQKTFIPLQLNDIYCNAHKGTVICTSGNHETSSWTRVQVRVRVGLRVGLRVAIRVNFVGCYDHLRYFANLASNVFDDQVYFRCARAPC